MARDLISGTHSLQNHTRNCGLASGIAVAGCGAPCDVCCMGGGDCCWVFASCPKPMKGKTRQTINKVRLFTGVLLVYKRCTSATLYSGPSRISEKSFEVLT